MGIAAYYRGNAVISRGIRGADVSVKPAPVPRPDDWGEKVRAKAARRAAGLVSYFKGRGVEVGVEDISYMVLDELKCGKSTALSAAKEALEGHGAIGEAPLVE